MQKSTGYFSVAAFLGLIVWTSISFLTGKSEAWDSKYYYMLGFPFLMVVSGVLGFLAPNHPWRWGVAVMVLQPVVLILQTFLIPSPGAIFYSAGVLFFLILTTPTILASYIGAYWGNRKKI